MQQQIKLPLPNRFLNTSIPKKLVLDEPTNV